MAKRKQFTLEEKKKAVELGGKIGFVPASREIGVSDATLYQWRKAIHPEQAKNGGGTHAGSRKGAVPKNGTPDLQLETVVAFLWGGLKKDVEAYAGRLHVPTEVVTGRLGEILRGKAHGNVLRA